MGLTFADGISETPEGLQKKIEKALLRGAILNRTYGTHKNLYIYLLLLTILGPIYYGPP